MNTKEVLKEVASSGQLLSAAVSGAKLIIEKIVDEVDKKDLQQYIKKLERGVNNRDGIIRDLVKEIQRMNSSDSQ